MRKDQVDYLLDLVDSQEGSLAAASGVSHPHTKCA